LDGAGAPQPEPSIRRYPVIMKINLMVVSLLLLMGSACSAVWKVAVQPVRVEGIAMEPALRDGDRILISRNLDRIERSDIVVFYFPFDESKSYIKRVVGLPNDRVEVRQGQVFVNGEKVAEPYVDSKNNQVFSSSKEIVVPEDNYFVIGDNRDNSSDSRLWGPLQRHFIYGKFVSKYYSAG
jgi:signal peptidase I